MIAVSLSTIGRGLPAVGGGVLAVPGCLAAAPRPLVGFRLGPTAIRCGLLSIRSRAVAVLDDSISVCCRLVGLRLGSVAISRGRISFFSSTVAVDGSVAAVSPARIQLRSISLSPHLPLATRHSALRVVRRVGWVARASARVLVSLGHLPLPVRPLGVAAPMNQILGYLKRCLCRVHRTARFGRGIAR
jgi:hypothetical protein